MISQTPLNFPDQLGDDGKRPTPVLVIAAVIGALAIVLIAVVAFTGGHSSPSPTPRPTPSGPVGSATPKPSTTPTTSASPSGGATNPPSGVDAFATEVCATPVAPFDQVSETLVAGFREYCLSSVAAVLTDESIDTTSVAGAGWAFTVGDPGAKGGAAVSRVFLDLDGESRVRSYLVTHGASGAATIVGNYAKVRKIADPQLVFSWTRP